MTEAYFTPFQKSEFNVITDLNVRKHNHNYREMHLTHQNLKHLVQKMNQLKYNPWTWRK